MRAKPPSFYLLNSTVGWRMLDESGEAVSNVDEIRLPGDPRGPLSLNSSDGSLGGLTLPRGMALDSSGILYLIGVSFPSVKRFDPQHGKFVRLDAIGREGSDARMFRSPQNISIAGDNLYVADTGNRRVQVFALPGLALRYVWTAPDPAEPWDPVDVTAHSDVAYILDRCNARVYVHHAGLDQPRLFFERADAAGRWSRIVLDRDETLYFLDPSKPRLQSFGAKAKDFTDPSQLSGRFESPSIRLDYKERFCLPQSLARPCDRFAPDHPASPELPLDECRPGSDGARVPFLFDRQGNPATREPAESPGPPLYQRHGSWFSEMEGLDSVIPNCQWHSIELDLRALPPGSTVAISTFTSDKLPSWNISDPGHEHLWNTHFSITGPMQSRPGASTGGLHEFLVQSRTGRYLWLRLKMESDGFTSPEVAGIRVDFPRQSYLDYLPAVYQSDEESRWFLERFLSIAQREWDSLDARVSDIVGYFDPKAVPAGPFLQYLAKWLALPLEESWNSEQQRVLLEAAPKFYKRRGTLDSLRQLLRAYLQNLSGATAGEMESVDYPQILEEFRARRYMMLSREGATTLGTLPLWGPGVMGRCQLGVFSTEGDVRMSSTGDPEHDVFQRFAHRFRVFIPAAWVRSHEDERKVRRALDTEKPSHTQYDLCLVEPRLRVGIQSTVGVDTIVGLVPKARLACAQNTTLPDNLQPQSRLGYDMVLGGTPPETMVMQLKPGLRMGIDSKLT